MSQIIKTYQLEVTISGLARQATVSITAEPEYLNDSDFKYWEIDDVEKTKKDLEAGILEVYSLGVGIKFVDLDYFEGFDSLGQVFVRTSNAINEALEVVSDNAMVYNATRDLVQSVLQGFESINQFLGKAS